MLDFLCKESYDLRDFVALITFLRSPDGCPWDQVQTHESIRRNFLEETYEVCEAIDAGDTAHLKEELGDVLMQVLFHTDIEREAVASGDADAVTEELGDLLFAAVKVARFAGIDPEQAAHAACEKFIRRFAAMEAAAADSGVPLEQRTLAQMQPLWQQAKQTASADNEGKKSARQ